MWFSFSTNILIFITAISLYSVYRRENIPTYYLNFVLFTGFSSLLAAFGHLPIIEASTGNKLMFVSRLLNFLSIYAFMSGTLQFFNYLQNIRYKLVNIALLLIFMYWLARYNVFTPVIIYSILSLVLVGVTSFLLNYKAHADAAIRVIFGVGILALAAIIFSLFKSEENMLAADIGHFLIAAALIVLMTGFSKLTKNEIKN